MKLKFCPFVIILIVVANFSYAQKSAIWIGGFAGREHDWFCPKNWNTNEIPNEFSSVIIVSQFIKNNAYPIISNNEVSIWSIFMDKQAKLLIAGNAQLIISDYIFIPNPHSIINQGIFAFNPDLKNINSNYITIKN